MKCFSVGLVVGFSLLAVSLAAPSTFENKEEKAFRECNATNPVQRNIRVVIGAGITTGEKIKISHEEKCHFYCFLQKVGFFDENGNIKGQGLVKFTLQHSPELAKYSDVVIAQVFQLVRSTKGFEDKCQKAFVTFHQYAQGIFELLVADSLQSATGVKNAINNAIENGKPVDQEISQAVKNSLEFFDAMITAEVKDYQRYQQQQGQAQTSHGHSQSFNAQSQGSEAQYQGSNAQYQGSNAQYQGSNAQYQGFNAQSQGSNAQSQGSSILQQQAKAAGVL